MARSTDPPVYPETQNKTQKNTHDNTRSKRKQNSCASLYGGYGAPARDAPRPQGQRWSQ